LSPNERQKILEEALRLKQSKNFQQAYALFEKILAEQAPFERTDYCLSNMGHIQYLTGHYDQARQLVEQAVSANPRNWFALSVLGEILLKQQQNDEALSAFQEAYQLNPAEIYLITRLAKVLQIQKKADEALALLQKSILAHPGDSRLLNGLGDLHAAKGERELARTEYFKAIQLNSQDQYAFRQWISTLEAEKSPEEILGEIQKLLRLPSQKNNAFLRDYYGKILAQLGRVDESIRELEVSVMSAPRNLYRKTRLAANYNRTNQSGKVVELLEAEFKNGVVDEYLFKELAAAYLQLGRQADARQLLIHALPAFPNDRTLRALLMKAR
jgi:tetratricopeptide (TPR) repeat protein